MRRQSLTGRVRSRRGVAAVWAVVVVGVLTVLLGTIAAQLLTNRRGLNRRQDRIQCLWLARAGVELAAARLMMADAAGYKGESIAPIPESQVRIVVQPEKDQPNIYLVTSESRYPTEQPHPVLQSVTRRFQRTIDKDRVRLEVVNPKPAASEDGAKKPPKI